LQEFDFNSFPREIHQQISSFLEDRAKRQMRLANTYWFKIINYTNFHIWIPRESMMDEMVKRLSTYTQPISLIFSKQGLLNDADLVPISRLTNLTSLQLHQAKLEMTSLHFSTLTNLEFFNLGATFDCYPLELLENFPKLRALSTWRLNIDFQKLAKAFEKLPNLETLRLIVETSDNVGIMSKIPVEKLTSLEVNFMAPFGFFAADGDRFTNLKSLVWHNDDDIVFPIEKLTNLVSLKCSSAGHVERIHQLTSLTSLSLRSMHEPDVDHLTKLTNLEVLDISSDRREEFDFLPSLLKLHTFSISAPICGDFMAVIPPDNMTHLNLLSYKGEELNAEHLERFSNLQSLEYGGAKMGLNVKAGFKHLTKLKHAAIQFWTQRLDDIDFSPWVQLESLILTRTTAHGAETLSALTNLTYLQIQLDGQSDFKFLENKPLRYLELDMVDAPGLWTYLPTLTSLEALKMGLVDENDDKIQLLTGLTRLTSLTVMGRITGKHFTCLMSLQSLILTCAESKAFYTEREQLASFMPNLMTYDSKGRLSTWRGQTFNTNY
jgi:hypothetical protein